MVSDILMGENVTSPGVKHVAYKLWLISQEVSGNGNNLIFFIIFIVVIILFFLWRNNNHRNGS